MPPLDHSGDAFSRVLDDIRRIAEALDDGGVPFSPVGFGLDCNLGLEGGGGGEARWGLAMDWADDPTQVGAPTVATLAPSREAPQDLADAVARQLGFTDAMTATVLAERWRAFVWANHPDRQPAEARETANARVALANALYDEARRKRAWV